MEASLPGRAVSLGCGSRMYSTCLFCNSPLGRNEVVEHFPVGRRLAFDAERGRLWVVCRACERWNLSALEERWEAIEECERLYRSTRLRVSTENIGLARLPEGLELVRIGRPERPEFAAWRYGDQFGRRRRRALLSAGLGLGALGAVVVGGVAAGVGVGAFAGWMGSIVERIVRGNPDAVVARIPAGEGDLLQVRRKELPKVRLFSYASGREWRLDLQLKVRRVEFVGEEAVRVSGMLLPALNRYGGSRKQVSHAVEFLDHAGGVGEVYREAAWLHAGRQPTGLEKLPYPVRLALEMAAHEETERRALEGELELLERAWREAEEIAEISDNLLVPPALSDWIRRLRGETA